MNATVSVDRHASLFARIEGTNGGWRYVSPSIRYASRSLGETKPHYALVEIGLSLSIFPGTGGFEFKHTDAILSAF